MKGTDHFKRTIYMYLEQRAEEDALFAKKYRNGQGTNPDVLYHITLKKDIRPSSVRRESELYP